MAKVKSKVSCGKVAVAVQRDSLLLSGRTSAAIAHFVSKVARLIYHSTTRISSVLTVEKVF